MDKRKVTLEETIKCFEHLISTIGEITTEYHWREFAAIVTMITENFPEYNLEEFQDSLFKDVNNDKENSDIIWD